MQSAFGRQDLQRHFPIERRILGQIHFAHAAGPEGGGAPVVFERTVDRDARALQRDCVTVIGLVSCRPTGSIVRERQPDGGTDCEWPR